MSELLIENSSIIDLSSVSSTDNMLFHLSNLIEKNNMQGKKVHVNFGQMLLDKSKLENLLYLFKGFDIDVDVIFAENLETKVAAVELGLTVSGQAFQKIEEQENIDPAEESSLDSIFFSQSGTEKRETLYVKQTLRSGQNIEFDGNIVLVGDCNAGSEIKATGDILVWGILSGIAHAGAKGDRKSCIRAFRINAIQIRIADLLARKPDSIDLEKSEKQNLFTPEEAKVSEDEIIIYSLY